jgi:hypothetical protein
MNTQPSSFARLALPALVAAVLPGPISAEAPAGPANASHVVLTGQVVSSDLYATMADAELWLEVDGQATAVPLSDNGRFTVTVPADREAVLRFEKPGHQPKEVLVDTRYAFIRAQGKPHQRKVRFGVVLEQDRHMAGQAYAGPVGALSFDAQGGCLSVDHRKSVVPAERKTMVF